MKYFKSPDEPYVEGYRCPECDYWAIIPVIELDEEDFKEILQDHPMAVLSSKDEAHQS